MIVVRRRGEGIRVSQDNDVVYHYTGANGLKGILDSGQFWATDMQYLNDTAELTLLQIEATKELRAYSARCPRYAEIVDSAIPMLPLESGSHYSISFSGDPDSLSQWRGYGGSQGYAIGFTMDSLARVARTTPMVPDSARVNTTTPRGQRRFQRRSMTQSRCWITNWKGTQVSGLVRQKSWQ
jgi:hypothetical protein